MLYIAPRPLRVCVSRSSRAAPRGRARDVSVDARVFQIIFRARVSLAFARIARLGDEPPTRCR